jgi:hypothetical protein
VDLLKSQVAAGSQLVLHGLEHRTRGRLRGRAWDQVRGMVFARNAAEFQALSPTEALLALEEGLDVLEQVGLPRPVAFCAPGWLLDAYAHTTVRRAGIRQVIGMFTVHDLIKGRTFRLPAIGYMGASPTQEAGVAILNSIVRRSILPYASAAKFYLHPQGDLRTPVQHRLIQEVAELVFSRGWLPTTYADVYGEG